MCPRLFVYPRWPLRLRRLRYQNHRCRRCRLPLQNRRCLCLRCRRLAVFKDRCRRLCPSRRVRRCRRCRCRQWVGWIRRSWRKRRWRIVCVGRPINAPPRWRANPLGLHRVFYRLCRSRQAQVCRRRCPDHLVREAVRRYRRCPDLRACRRGGHRCRCPERVLRTRLAIRRGIRNGNRAEATRGSRGTHLP